MTAVCDILAKASVVRIALAAASPASSLSAVAARPMAAVTDGIGRRGPITPVEATSTCSRGISSAVAAVSTISQASARPPSPVQALARPELVTIARAVPERIWVRLTITGAATTELRVKTPAADAG